MLRRQARARFIPSGQSGYLEAVGLGFLNWAGSTSNSFCKGESLCGGLTGALSDPL